MLARTLPLSFKFYFAVNVGAIIERNNIINMRDCLAGESNALLLNKHEVYIAIASGADYDCIALDIALEGVGEMSERDMTIKRTGASWQVLQELLKTLTEQLGANAHEVILLKARLTCKNCLESSYHGKTASTPEEWRCKHYGAIPATFKGSCEKWQDNVARR